MAAKKPSLLSFPCWKESLSIGIVTGALFAFHRFRGGHKQAVLVADSFVKAFCLSSLGTYAVCITDHESRKSKLVDRLHELNEAQKAEAARLPTPEQFPNDDKVEDL